MHIDTPIQAVDTRFSHRAIYTEFNVLLLHISIMRRPDKSRFCTTTNSNTVNPSLGIQS